ncbi:glycosyl hydrolase family 28 protein [Hahella sp. NBU794]|uniref:glycosyl hydrolase family 28 protein n=1 Tax=Hahella sp. NBU794 TaxID=3422590 RepID=UPI003D6EEF8B
MNRMIGIKLLAVVVFLWSGLAQADENPVCSEQGNMCCYASDYNYNLPSAIANCCAVGDSVKKFVFMDNQDSKVDGQDVPIQLCSNLNLYILHKLKAPSKDDWPPIPKGEKRFPPLFKGENLENVVIAGDGEIDGRNNTWMGDKDCGDYDGKVRPIMMDLQGSKNLLVKSITLSHGPGFNLHVEHSRGGIEIEDVTVNTHHNGSKSSCNLDGMDISGDDISIKDSEVRSRDDCIAVKANSSNVRISNVTCHNGHGLSIGSIAMNGVVKDVEVENVTVMDSHFGLRIKMQKYANGKVENIKFKDSLVKRISSNPIQIKTDYHNDHCDDPGSSKCDKNARSSIENVTYKKISVHGGEIDLNCKYADVCTVKLRKLHCKDGATISCKDVDVDGECSCD